MTSTGADGNRLNFVGGYRCCMHCADDDIHDIPPSGHQGPCQMCADPRGLLLDRTNAAEAELARTKALLAARTDALNRTVTRAELAEATIARSGQVLVALIETIENDDSGEPVCHDYDRIDNGQCALLADLLRLRDALDGGQP